MTSFTEQISAAPLPPSIPAAMLAMQGAAQRWLAFGSRLAALQVAASRTLLARQQKTAEQLLAPQAPALPALMTDLAQQQWCAAAAYGRAWIDIVCDTAPAPGPSGAPLALAAPAPKQEAAGAETTLAPQAAPEADPAPDPAPDPAAVPEFVASAAPLAELEETPAQPALQLVGKSDTAAPAQPSGKSGARRRK